MRGKKKGNSIIPSFRSDWIHVLWSLLFIRENFASMQTVRMFRSNSKYKEDRIGQPLAKRMDSLIGSNRAVYFVTLSFHARNDPGMMWLQYFLNCRKQKF